ncbi:ATP-binding cassette domain-containing protein [Streptomyces sp. NPDC001508]|uniref:ABC transporter ATP-binding protein n=1 Tax=Streptomyces sp. NPDC001508 TaxID=3154656 RepID=UPI00331CC048
MTRPTDVPLVAAEHLTKSFRVRRQTSMRAARVDAVRDVSLQVATGASVGLVGESGSGKSTIARMVMGLERPTAGTISIEGEERPSHLTARLLRRQARRLQMVFQDPATSLNPRQQVAEMLDEVQRVHFTRTRAERERRTTELLDSCGLASRESKAQPRELSGGQRQRVAIARALAAEPSMIVLDEAVSALDVSVQAQVLNTLADVRAEYGLTYLFISHDLAVIGFLCEQVIVLRDGQIVEQGDSKTVFSHPTTDYTRNLIDSIPRVPASWEAPRI